MSAETGGVRLPVREPAVDRLGRALLLAPMVFVAHVFEESHGFVPWFNGHVARDITPDLFWSVNLGGLVITMLPG